MKWKMFDTDFLCIVFSIGQFDDDALLQKIEKSRWESEELVGQKR